MTKHRAKHTYSAICRQHGKCSISKIQASLTLEIGLKNFLNDSKYSYKKSIANIFLKTHFWTPGVSKHEDPAKPRDRFFTLCLDFPYRFFCNLCF